MTNLYDQRERESEHTLCEDLEWHECGASPSERTLRIRDLNDALRSARDHPALRIATRELVITPGVADHRDAFIMRALEAVRLYSDFSPSNDPYGEHDFSKFQVDGYDLFWKIDYYGNDLENGSPNPADAALTKRVLTVLLAEEY